MLRTPLTALLALDWPIVQAGMGSIAGADLAAAVSEAGGLGTIALVQLPPDAVRDLVIAQGVEADALAFYAGQGVGLARAVEPAGALVRRLGEEAAALIRGRLAGMAS